MAEPHVSELFDAARWRVAPGFDDLTDLTYHLDTTGRVARIALDRPEVRNAFRPHTVDELYRALDDARQNPRVGVVLLTGNGPSAKDGGWAFCSGGDQRIRGRGGYQYAEGETADTVDAGKASRLHILEVQRLIRFMPKVVMPPAESTTLHFRRLVRRDVLKEHHREQLEAELSEMVSYRDSEEVRAKEMHVEDPRSEEEKQAEAELQKEMLKVSQNTIAASPSISC